VRCFADTSLLCALYQKRGATKSAAAVRNHLNGTSLLISDIVEFEFKASLRLQVFRHEHADPEGFSEQDAQEANERFDADIVSATIKIIPSEWTQVIAFAGNLAKNYASQSGARSMDILHVAAAFQLQCTHFATFDDRQWLLAQKAGFAVLPDILPSDYRKLHEVG
jgi:predicted nucleic acid-binding protein